MGWDPEDRRCLCQQPSTNWSTCLSSDDERPTTAAWASASARHGHQRSTLTPSACAPTTTQCVARVTNPPLPVAVREVQPRDSPEENATGRRPGLQAFSGAFLRLSVAACNAATDDSAVPEMQGVPPSVVRPAQASVTALQGGCHRCSIHRYGEGTDPSP